MVNSFRDAREIATGDELDADLCIVGSGAAGVTLARSFIGSGLRVIVLEAGGLSVDPEVTALSTIQGEGRPYPNMHSHRLRYFGGTTNHWGGHCVALEPLDFERQDWIPHSGWPYSYDALAPYYDRAHEVLGIGNFDFDPKPLADAFGYETFPFDPTKIKTTLSRYRPVRFGLAFGDALDQASNINVVLYADVSNIALDEAASETVSHLDVRSLAGNAFKVKAKRFVVASGGIENPRLLLLSNGQREAGLGNQNDLVGRYFQEHLWAPSGLIRPQGPWRDLRFYVGPTPYQDHQVRAHIAITEEHTRALKIARFRTEIRAVNATKFTVRELRAGRVDLGDVAALMLDPASVGAAMKCDAGAEGLVYMLNNYVQQVPNPDSRISLSDVTDAFGRPQPKLDWRLSDIDHQSVLTAHREIAQEVGRAGVGRMRIEIEQDWETPLVGAHGGSHHMGTTRMDADPKLGVVDADAKVHGADNLYMAGSSIFPTCGWPNPTLTIVATSLKLADHLKQEFAKEGRA